MNATTENKCAVICRNANGAPDFFACVIECTDEQRDEGEMDFAAINLARDNKYDVGENSVVSAMVTTENDPLWEVLDYAITWEDVPKITL
jgi:hypothetical protein